MRIHVAVVDPLPLYQRGVATSLDGLGLVVDVPDDIRAWTMDGEARIVLLSLCAPKDWQLLADLHAARPDVSLVALIDAPDPASYLRALGGGALCAAPRASSSDALQQVVGALLNGQVILPAEIVRALVEPQRRGSPRGGAMPSAQELAWLGRLADGSTVTELARRAGYSEREMFRRLRSLYDKLSVGGRTEALIHTRDMGWI